ncbi:MAG: glycosyltransferase family 39 protein, partial [Candidatus Abyssubacteria bacterium]|nr:glycosyltransferase family 39 protein [Candidatus Abyssubacteria bacterium]
MVKERKSVAAPYIFAAIVIMGAVLYFSLTYYRTINPVDEGYLLYNYVKTAEGQIPHLDFYDNYGPAIYWLGGGLFKLFGTSLMVIRVFMVILKTAMALLVFLIARKILPTLFALIAAFLFVLTWGDPYFPAMNVLYAGYISHFLALLGILFIIQYVKRENLAWLLGTSVCLGLSALFKFHSAAFDLIGFSVFLTLKEQARRFGPESPENPGADIGSIPTRLMRAGKCAGILMVMIFYLALFVRDHLDLYYFLIFLFPYFLLLGHILIADLKSFGPGEATRRPTAALRKCYIEIGLLLSGPVVFLALVLIYYYAVDGLDELIYDTFALPMAMKFYKPMEDYRLHAALIAGAVMLISGMIAIGKRLQGRSKAQRVSFCIGAFLLAVLPPIVLLAKSTPFETWQMRVIYIVPASTLLLMSGLFVGKWQEERISGRDFGGTLLLGLVFIFACQGFLMSFPRTDTNHVQANSTVIFILIAYLFHKMHLGWRALLQKRGGICGAVFTALCLAMIVAPLLWSMKVFYFISPDIPESLRKQIPARILDRLDMMGPLKSYPEIRIDFPRAPGLVSPMWPFRPLLSFVSEDIYQTAHFIMQNTRSDERIFVMCGPQIIYFLTERHSAVGKENYFVYLAATGLIDRADSVRLTDDRLARQIFARPPLIVRVFEQYGDQSQKIADIWPDTAWLIEGNYERAAKFGVYEILRPRVYWKNW